MSGIVVPHVTTPDDATALTIALARPGPGDVVVDLGCGDGRLVIAAVAQGGAARGVGVELDPVLAATARANVQRAGLSERITILEQDFFAADLREATRLVFYLLFTVNVRLRPKLIRELEPGTRLVSYRYSMGEDWPADEVAAGSRIYAWTVPAAVGGLWRADGLALRLWQSFQSVRGDLTLDGTAHPVRGRLCGGAVDLADGHSLALRATAEGDSLTGELVLDRTPRPVRLERVPFDPTGTWVRDDGGPALRIEPSGATLLDEHGRATPVPHFYRWGASFLLVTGDVEHGLPDAICEGLIEGDRMDGTTRAPPTLGAPWAARRT